MTSDPCLKRMAVWRRDVGGQMKEKELNGKDQRAKRDRNKGVEWRMQDLGKHQPLGLWGRVQCIIHSFACLNAYKRGLKSVR